MPDLGRGMLFPPSYFRDQYTPEEEARQDAETRRAEQQDEALEWLDELPEAHPCPSE